MALTALLTVVLGSNSWLAFGQQPAITRKVKTKVAPAYPEIARHMSLGGTVKLIVVVGANGSVKSVQCLVDTRCLWLPPKVRLRVGSSNLVRKKAVESSSSLSNRKTRSAWDLPSLRQIFPMPLFDCWAFVAKESLDLPVEFFVSGVSGPRFNQFIRTRRCGPGPLQRRRRPGEAVTAHRLQPQRHGGPTQRAHQVCRVNSSHAYCTSS